MNEFFQRKVGNRLFSKACRFLARQLIFSFSTFFLTCFLLFLFVLFSISFISFFLFYFYFYHDFFCLFYTYIFWTMFLNEELYTVPEFQTSPIVMIYKH